MGWWSRIEDGTKITGETAKWIWSWTSTPLTTALSYTGNTLVYGLNQIVALRESIPALASSPESMKTLEAVKRITFSKILPLMALNTLNTYLQTCIYSGDKGEENIAWYNTTVMYAGSLINLATNFYTYRQGAELLAETLILDSLAPSIFNANKPQLLADIPSPCEKEQCTYKRLLKGDTRQFIQSFVNDLLTWGINQIPYAGKPLSTICSIYFAGDLIVRSALPERCERHRTTDSEMLLATGALYTTFIKLMDNLFEATVGAPPFLVQRTIRHLMLLFMVNNTMHMKIRYVAPGTGTLDITAYGRLSGFVIDIFFAGSMNQLTKIFHPEPNTKPLFSLPQVLKTLTHALNSDFEKEHVSRPGFFKKAITQMSPPIFRSTKSTVNNPVVRIFWPNLREILLEILGIIEDIGIPLSKLTNTSLPIISQAVKKALPKALYHKYGISEKLTLFLLTLCKEEDFWRFVLALHQWLERHQIDNKTTLAPLSPKRAAALHVAPVSSLPALTARSTTLNPTTYSNPHRKTTLNPDFFATNYRKKTTLTTIDNYSSTEKMKIY